MTRHVLGDTEWAALKARPQSIGGLWKHEPDKRNRRFVQAVYSLLRTGLAWADLPDAFGNSDAVRKRFRRWCKTGIWQRLLKGGVPVEQIEKRMLDGTICKAHRHAAGARGGAEEDIRRSRGGRTTKIGAAVCATTQKIVRAVLVFGQRHDCALAAAMLGPVEGAIVIADKAFDTDPCRGDLAARGCPAMIPSKENRRHPKKRNKAVYSWRHGIETGFARMKDFKRITLRRDKTSVSYRGFLHLACAVLNIQRDACLAREGSLRP